MFRKIRMKNDKGVPFARAHATENVRKYPICEGEMFNEASERRNYNVTSAP